MHKQYIDQAIKTLSKLYKQSWEYPLIVTQFQDNFIKNRIILIIAGNYYGLNIIVCTFVYEYHPTDVRILNCHTI